MYCIVVLIGVLSSRVTFRPLVRFSTR
jgi:hypothetical protein